MGESQTLKARHKNLWAVNCLPFAVFLFFFPVGCLLSLTPSAQCLGSSLIRHFILPNAGHRHVTGQMLCWDRETSAQLREFMCLGSRTWVWRKSWGPTEANFHPFFLHIIIFSAKHTSLQLLLGAWGISALPW